MDKRHIRRQELIQELYALSFVNDSSKTKISDKTKEINGHALNFDIKIQQFAQKYAIDKIAKVDIAILHLALFELLIEKTVPPKVVINEAVELAKEMGGEKSPSFINAILGKIYETEYPDHGEPQEASQEA